MLPNFSGAQFLLFQKSVQSIGLLIIFVFTFSIPHRQCKTTAFISFFLHHTPHALQNQLFSLKKYVDLFYVRIAVTRAFTGFTDIFLHSENLMLRSTYFSIMYPELFTAQSLIWKMYTCKFLWILFRGNEHSFRINGCN